MAQYLTDELGWLSVSTRETQTMLKNMEIIEFLMLQNATTYLTVI